MAKTIGYFSNVDFNKLSLFEDFQANLTLFNKLGGNDVAATATPKIHFYTDKSGKIVPITTWEVLTDGKEGLQENPMDEETFCVGELGQHIASANPSLIKKEIGQSYDQITSYLTGINMSEDPVASFKKRKLYTEIEAEKLRAQIENATGGWPRNVLSF